MPQLLTVAEAAAQLSVHEDTVRRLLERGELNAVRIGRAVRIDAAELEELVNRGRPRRSYAPPAATKLTDGQMRAFYAKCGWLDAQRELKRGTSKQAALAAVSHEFGYTIEHVRSLTEGQASWTLEWLAEQQERENY